MKVRRIAAAAITCLYASPTMAEWSGVAQVVSGNTLTLNGTMVSLNGVDAPSPGQPCRGPDGQAYDCGYESAQELLRLIGDQPIRCVQVGRGRRHDLPLTTCTAGPTDLNAEMVRSGWAVTDGSRDYRRAEGEASTARRGMWQGKFQRPAEWRKANGGL